ncbi:hypothetical protein [Halobacterium jilantaiense]|uniref:DUF7979 domain-containing protein n=1 Tax=Halobacterium jilantaiense TaxID=355548 RepID=A0A1I0P111_9EURY|nr:hypothetical protein [Halobacterium jilantaiense]SEW07894.1 hypothetical protein SAMN04487945_1316 [Halobacterium jilantaiense]
MTGTVDPPDVARRKRLYYGLFILGTFMCAAAVMLTLPALQYEFQQEATGATTEGDGIPYDVLTDQQQRVVDGALDGEQYVFETSQPLPGRANLAFEPTQLRVRKNGMVHTFTYQSVFPATEPMGLTVIGLAVGGLLTIVESVRRYHFAN